MKSSFQGHPEMKFVADESVDYGIISQLRDNHFEVYSIMDETPGINDSKVLEIANILKCVLITEDKDFGELSFRLNFNHHGILLIRLTDLPRTERISFVIENIKKHSGNLVDNFSVINNNGLKIKKTAKNK